VISGGIAIMEARTETVLMFFEQMYRGVK
jgi:hypothetical protein